MNVGWKKDFIERSRHIRNREYHKPVVVIVGHISGVIVLNFSCKFNENFFRQIEKLSFHQNKKLESGFNLEYDKKYPNYSFPFYLQYNPLQCANTKF